MNSLGRDLASQVQPFYAAAAASLTAAGAGDNTEVVGVTIDTTQIAAGKRFESITFVFGVRAVLETGFALNLTAKIEHSDDGVSFSDLVASKNILALASTAVGSPQNQQELGGAEIGFGMDQAKRYVRVRYTPDLTRGGTDTATVQVVGVAGGASSL